MKKYSLHILLSLVLIMLGGFLFQNRTEVARAFANLTTYGATSTSTTTPTYLAGGTSSILEKTFPTNGLDTLEVSGNSIASSSTGSLHFTFLTSSDNIDFYPLTFPTTTPTLSVGGTIYDWSHGGTATTSFAFAITPTGAFTKVQVTAGTSTAPTSRAAVYLKAGTR